MVCSCLSQIGSAPSACRGFGRWGKLAKHREPVEACGAARRWRGRLGSGTEGRPEGARGWGERRRRWWETAHRQGGAARSDGVHSPPSDASHADPLALHPKAINQSPFTLPIMAARISALSFRPFAPVQAGGADVLTDLDVLADRNKAFETFRRSYRKSEVIEENVALLRDKYAVAKSLGESVNAARDRINQLKAVIERERAQRMAAAVAAGSDPSQQAPGREELDALGEMARSQFAQKGAVAETVPREAESHLL